jgi:hypothetical protein
LCYARRRDYWQRAQLASDAREAILLYLEGLLDDTDLSNAVHRKIVAQQARRSRLDLGDRRC